MKIELDPQNYAFSFIDLDPYIYSLSVFDGNNNQKENDSFLTVDIILTLRK